jgi:hypothetical protein
MRYLYTTNATRGYMLGRTGVYFEAMQVGQFWHGVISVSSEQADQLIEKYPTLQEVDEVFYEEFLKKKKLQENPNRKTVQVTLDSTKPVHAHYKEKDAESAGDKVDEIEVIDVEVVEPKQKRGKKKK